MGKKSRLNATVDALNDFSEATKKTARVCVYIYICACTYVYLYIYINFASVFAFIRSLINCSPTLHTEKDTWDIWGRKYGREIEEKESSLAWNLGESPRAFVQDFRKKRTKDDFARFARDTARGRKIGRNRRDPVVVVGSWVEGWRQRV